MSNEEIREEIKKCQNQIQEMLAQSYTFELNPEIAKIKHQIDNLRDQCTHLNPNHEIQIFNNCCVYCGRKIR